MRLEHHDKEARARLNGHTHVVSVLTRAMRDSLPSSDVRPPYMAALEVTHQAMTIELAPYVHIMLEVLSQTALEQQAYLEGHMSQEELATLAQGVIGVANAGVAVDLLSEFAPYMRGVTSLESWRKDSQQSFGILAVSLQFLSEIGEIEPEELVLVGGILVRVGQLTGDSLRVINSHREVHGASKQLLLDTFVDYQVEDSEGAFSRVRRELLDLNMYGGRGSVIVERKTKTKQEFNIAPGITVEFPEDKGNV